MFARELDGGRKVFAELVEFRKIQTRVVGRVLAAFRMDVNSMESAGKDMIKTRTEEGSVFVASGRTANPWRFREKMRRGLGWKKAFLLPLGWKASSGRCS